jgi:hypothetical protein
MKLLLHFFVLISSFGLAFIWEQSQLDNYTIPLLSIFAIIFIIALVVNKRRKKDLVGGAVDVFALNTAIILAISITGNLYSPLYFILYFLGFGITFIFEPLSVFIYVLGAIIIFLPEALKNGSPESFIRLGSLVLISPLAFFFGHEYSGKNQSEEKLKKSK